MPMTTKRHVECYADDLDYFHPSEEPQDGERTELINPMHYTNQSYHEWVEDGSLPLSVKQPLFDAVGLQAQLRAQNENIKLSANRVSKVAAQLLQQ